MSHRKNWLKNAYHDRSRPKIGNARKQAKISYGKEKEKKAATLCRWLSDRLDNGRRLLFIAVKENTKKDIQDYKSGLVVLGS